MDPKPGRSLFLAVACSGLALYGPAIAQQQDQGAKKQESAQKDAQKSDAQKSDSATSGSSSQQQGAQKKEPVAGRIKLGTTVIEAEAIAKGFRASKLIGSEVRNDQGERIGKIEDMVISPDGKVTMAVLEVGGFLGIGDHRVAIPVDQFSTLGPNPVLPGANKQTVRALPRFQYARA
jgi:sporulation protein YlmC with PRC-barrel domain